MKRKTRRRFSPEFKQEAVRLTLSGEKSVAQVARELGLHREVLRNWKRQLEALGRSTPIRASTPNLFALEEENRRLRKENARLKEEHEILKKAAAYFASESR